MQLTPQEFRQTESGTLATKVKTYNDDGNLVDVIYVLMTEDDEYYSDVEDAQCVTAGYMTDTSNVRRK